MLKTLKWGNIGNLLATLTVALLIIKFILGEDVSVAFVLVVAVFCLLTGISYFTNAVLNVNTEKRLIFLPSIVFFAMYMLQIIDLVLT